MTESVKLNDQVFSWANLQLPDLEWDLQQNFKETEVYPVISSVTYDGKQQEASLQPCVMNDVLYFSRTPPRLQNVMSN